jgi:hypothetical protein
MREEVARHDNGAGGVAHVLRDHFRMVAPAAGQIRDQVFIVEIVGIDRLAILRKGFQLGRGLLLEKLSMITMSPFESVGARDFSTHSSNDAALIGRLRLRKRTSSGRGRVDKLARASPRIGSIAVLQGRIAD